MKKLSDYKPCPYLIPQVDLEFELDRARTLVKSKFTLTPNPNSSEPLTPIMLNGENLELIEVKREGKKLGGSDYQLTQTHLILEPTSNAITLEITCAISPEKNLQLDGLYASEGILCTQCEAEGFRHITYFFDRPDVMSRFSVKLIAKKAEYSKLLAGGNLVETKDLENGRHMSYWVDPWPKPAYLFALAAGNLFEIHDTFTTMSGKLVDLFLYCEPHNSRRLGFALVALKRAMQWDEEVYGREYDLSRFQIVAVDAFNMGAMENKGLNIFNAQCLLAETSATTDDEFRRIEAIIAHEYFHNWTGNRITCRDWFQLTLKEGLTVFRDHSFSCDFHDRGVVRLEQVQALFTRQYPEDAGATAHPIQPRSYTDINNFYTPTVYEKGSEVISMMHRLLGEKWRKGMDCYFEKNDLQAVTTEDFVKALEEGSGVDLKKMRRWYTHYCTPRVSVKRSKINYGLSLTVSQEPTPNILGDSLALPMPFQVALFDPTTGKKLLEETLLLEEWEKTWQFKAAADTLVSFNRSLSCPVIVKDDHTLEERARLALIDDDATCRFIYSRDNLKELYRHYLQTKTINSSFWINFVQATLQDSNCSLHLKSLFIRLPSISEMLEWEKKWNIEAAITFFDTLQKATANELQETFWDIYHKNHFPKEGEFNADLSGKRHIKMAAMEYLVSTESDKVFEVLLDQQNKAICMSDEASSLRLLCSCENRFREESLQTYASKWHKDNLTWPKWLLAQALSKAPDTLERCEKLIHDPRFNIKIPNQARALIDGFAMNLRHFHAKTNGYYKGYEWIAEKIEWIDTFNTQMAARAAKRFAILPRLEGERYDHLKAVLEKMLAKTHLSASTREIIHKCLT